MPSVSPADGTVTHVETIDDPDFFRPRIADQYFPVDL